MKTKILPKGINDSDLDYYYVRAWMCVCVCAYKYVCGVFLSLSRLVSSCLVWSGQVPVIKRQLRSRVWDGDGVLRSTDSSEVARRVLSSRGYAARLC